MYYWTFGSFAMPGLAGVVEPGPWIQATRSALLAGQEQDPGVRGSSNPNFDPWGYTDERVYATAMGALALEGALRMDAARYATNQ